MKEIQTCESQEEAFQHFISALDNEKYRMLPLKFVSLEKEKYSEIEEFINQTQDDVSITWDKVRNMLPQISNVNLLYEFKGELEFFSLHVKYKIENRKVFYNQRFFREFDDYYQKNYGISIYDKIKSDHERTILFLIHVSKIIEKRISNIDMNASSNKAKSLSLKFMKNKTDTAAIFLMLESSGLFYQQGKKKEINKILEGAKFYEDGEFVSPKKDSLLSIISRNRKGKDSESTRALNGKIKKELIRVAKDFISNLESGEYSIYEKH